MHTVNGCGCIAARRTVTGDVERMARLQIISGPKAGTSIVLTEATVTVGRVPENAVCLPDITVSRNHAVFIKTGEEYVLRDLDSTNGTFVNELRITQSPLKTDVPLRFGAIKVLFSAEPSPVAVATPAPVVSQPVVTRPVAVAPAPPPPVPAPKPVEPEVASKPKAELRIGSLLKKRVEMKDAEKPAAP
jgi:hypothetical protein